MAVRGVSYIQTGERHKQRSKGAAYRVQRKGKGPSNESTVQNVWNQLQEIPFTNENEVRTHEIIAV